MAASENCVDKVYYVSDIEGNFDYFKKFVDLSPGISFSSCQTMLEFENNTSGFVFGGDLFDKGSYDIRLSHLLCDFKDKYPNRVWLLMGNRDVNKLRFSSELDDGELNHLHNDHPFWDSKVPGLQSWLTENNLEHSLVSRLKYILIFSMGAPNAFENRRKELFEMKYQIGFLYGKINEKKKNSEYSNENTIKITENLNHETIHEHHNMMYSENIQIDISDEMVLESFRDSVKPNGFVTRFLSLAEIGVRVKDTVFVHGAITRKGLLYVPGNDLLHRHYHGTTSPGQYLDDDVSIDDWFSKLSDFKNKAIEDFKQRPKWEGEPNINNFVDGVSPTAPVGTFGHYDWSRRRGGESLLGYHSGASSNKRNIIVESFLTFQDNPLAYVSNIDIEVIQYLTKHNNHDIRRIIVGHRPVGMSPLVVKFNQQGIPGLQEQTVVKHFDGHLGGKSHKDSGGNGEFDHYFEVVCADTSFSDPNYAPNNTRGMAAFSLSIDFKVNTSTNPSLLTISGNLPNGEELHCNTNHDLIGRCTSDGHWVCGYQNKNKKQLINLKANNLENHDSDHQEHEKTKLKVQAEVGEGYGLVFLTVQFVKGRVNSTIWRSEAELRKVLDLKITNA